MHRFAIALVLLSACDEGGAPRGSVTCQEADLAYGEARASDAKLRELASCRVDADCALWQPTLTCDGFVHLRDCNQATHVDNVEAAVARNAELTDSICEHITPLCNIGVSCPDFTAACVAGSCTALGNSGGR